MTRVVVIGGDAAGMSAAAQASLQSLLAEHHGGKSPPNP